jgi:dolichyl-phosphate beta-glucosyltransferase
VIIRSGPGYNGPISLAEASISDRALDLSIVIPALNEAERLPATLDRLYEYLRRQDYTWEIVVVSNGSTDATDDVVRAASARIPNLRLVSLSARGKGLAARVGALRSTGRIVFLCDADLSMPPEALDGFLKLSQENDVVAGSREAAGARRVGEPWHRHFMGRVFNRCVQFLAVPGINDTQCGFKAFHRSVVDNLFGRQTVNGFGFDVELLYLARKYGYRVAELGIEWRFDSDTRVRPGVDTVNMLAELIAIRWRDLIGVYRQERQPAAGEEHV